MEEAQNEDFLYHTQVPASFKVDVEAKSDNEPKQAEVAATGNEESKGT